MKPALSIEAGALVLRGVYRAAARIEAGDSLRLNGPLLVSPTGMPNEDVVGLAYASAGPGEDVAVVIAGVYRTRVVENVVRGDSLVPSDTVPGRGRRQQGLSAQMAASARRHALALEDAVGGRSPLVQLLRQ